MKTKDRMFPTIEEYYPLRLQPVVSEPSPQRRWDRSGADRRFALAGAIDSLGGRVSKATPTRH